ncbi:ANF_receptor domain-containing protein [Meloidogyne graminicola]|uniref:ANF_receptor domain-containing protein n=1 Tax=Meloidogyne graminicola TaxID=189291 RepID=A0A8S9ZYK2_9BILA|nr:ANF_receptor domain-containing protein [Meloidogyne graminicola]
MYNNNNNNNNNYYYLIFILKFFNFFFFLFLLLILPLLSIKQQQQHHNQRKHPLISSKFNKFPLNIVVGLPSDFNDNPLRNPYKLSISKAQPVFDVAIEDIIIKFKILPSNSLFIAYEDTQLSDAIGPQKIVNHYCNKTVDVVMGMPYVFALAPIARMSQFWGIGGVPVFTTTVLIINLNNK